MNKDFMGFFASMLCAVHCAALPFILAISALSGLSFLGNHAIELVFLVLSSILAIWSLLPSYQQRHHNPLPLRIVSMGFVLLISARFLPHGTAEHILTACGGTIIAYSHWLNWRLLRRASKACC